MNVTRLNLRDCIPFIRKCFDQASHFALDIEMTGILTNDILRNSVLDSFQSRYLKTKRNIQTFLPVQLGVCTFSPKASHEHTYIASPFNFYIYPLMMNNEDNLFSFSSGSMRFLANNDFDFNRLFYEGIPYVSQEDRRKYESQANLQRIRDTYREMDKVVTPDMKAFYNLHFSTILEWLKSSEKQRLEIPIHFIKNRSIQHLLTSVRQKAPNLLFSESFDRKSMIERQVLYLDKRQPNSTQNDKQPEYNDDHLLLPNLVEQMSKSCKPVIVHNGFLDLMHIYHKFIGRLPEDVDEYKQKLSSVFPLIYDTKYLSSASIVLNAKLNKETNLENCFKTLSKEQQPTIQIHQNTREYSLAEESEGSHHEAGYDALMTGIVYLKAKRIMEQLAISHNKSIDEVFKFYKNRVPLGNVTSPFNLNERGDNYKGNNKIFYLTSVLHQPVRSSDIQAHFQQNFGQVNIFYMARYDTSFGLEFQNKEKEKQFEEQLLKSQGISLISINQIKFLAFDDERYMQYMKNVKIKEEEQTVDQSQI